MKIRGTTISTPMKPEAALVKCKNLSPAQKTLARQNIGAADVNTVMELDAEVRDIKEYTDATGATVRDLDAEIKDIKGYIDETGAITVFIDESTGKAGYTSQEINNFVHAGAQVMLEYAARIIPLSYSATDLARFTIVLETGESLSYIIDDEGNYAMLEADYVGQKEIDQAEKNVIDKLAPTFTESGSVVQCEPVEGYPLTVVSQIELETSGDNLIDSGYKDISNWEGSISGDGGYYFYRIGTIKTSVEYYFCGYTDIPVHVGRDNPDENDMFYSYSSGENGSGEFAEVCNIPVNTWNEGYEHELALIIYAEDVGTYNEEAGVWSVDEETLANHISNMSLYLYTEIPTEHSEANLTRCGKNIIGKLEKGLYLSPGGEASEVKGFVRSVDYLPVTPGQTYKFSKDGTAITVYVHEYDANKQWLRRPSINAVTGYTPTEGVRFIRFNTNNAEHTPEDAFQLELGSTATAYEPYRWDTLTVNFGRRTVYGGTYNWTTGLLTDQDGNTHQLPPTEILAIPGVNTLYSDTGNTTVTGKADPTAVIEKLTNAIIALGGNV